MAQSKNGMNVFDLVYPIGSIYLSVSDANPATLFGGSWERIKDRFLLAAGDSYAAGGTGGEANHTLTVEEIPSHNHDLGHNVMYVNTNHLTGSGSIAHFYATDAIRYTAYTGGSAAHNNMPPYLTVHIWKRVS